jgi:hypothetical protein
MAAAAATSLSRMLLVLVLLVLVLLLVVVRQLLAGMAAVGTAVLTSGQVPTVVLAAASGHPTCRVV